MQRVRLGPGSLEISRLVYGSMGRSDESRAAAAAILDAALEAGVTAIDTAPLYDFGAVEERLGAMLAGRRERVELLSKVGLRWDDDHGDVLFVSDPPDGPRRVVRRDGRPDSIRREVEASLTRLRTDRLDLCQIHQHDERVPIEETLGALSDLAREGKVLHVGVSNFEPATFARAVSATDPMQGGPGLAGHQLPFSLLTRAAEQTLLPMAKRAGVGVLAYSPLEVGALTDRLLAPGPIDDTTRARSVYLRAANPERIAEALRDLVRPVAERLGATIAQVCLAWVLEHEGVDAAIVGASGPEQMRANAAADALALSADDHARLATGFARLPIDRAAGQGLGARLRARLGRLRRRLDARGGASR